MQPDMPGRLHTVRQQRIVWAVGAAAMDGELCGVLPDGRTAFNLIQNATDTGEGSLVFFLFDLLFLDGEDLTALPLLDRKVRLASLLRGAPDSLRYNDHHIGNGPAFHRVACQHGLEGMGPDGKLIYAGRVGTGMPVNELQRLWQRLQPLVIGKMPLAIPPPRGTRFGSALVLSRFIGCARRWSWK
jgi:bifunctional non-homologous end joining protein LigD